MTLATTVACAGDGRARFRRAVDAHFAGRISTADERALREHLPACGDAVASTRAPTRCRRSIPRHRPLANGWPRGSGSAARAAPDDLCSPAWPGPCRRWRWSPSGSCRACRPVTSRRLGPARRGRSGGACAARLPDRGQRYAPRAGRGRRDRQGARRAGVRLQQPGRLAFPDDLRRSTSTPTSTGTTRPGGSNTPPPAAVVARVGPGPFELPSATRHALDGRRFDRPRGLRPSLRRGRGDRARGAGRPRVRSADVAGRRPDRAALVRGAA